MLITTPQFAALVARITEPGWNVAQLKTRARRCIELPAKPTRDDVQAIAESQLGGSSAAAIAIAVNYACAVKHPLPALADLAEDARMSAESEGRDTVTKADMEAALRADAIPTAALKERLSPPPEEKPKRKTRGGHADKAPASRRNAADDFQTDQCGDDDAPEPGLPVGCGTR